MSELLKEAEDYALHEKIKLAKQYINDTYKQFKRRVDIAQSSLDDAIESLNCVSKVISSSKDPILVKKYLNKHIQDDSDFGRHC